MRKYGIEVEFFGTRKNQFVDAAAEGLPHDDYPILVEARGLPHTDIFQAVASVRGELESILNQMKLKGIKPCFHNGIAKDTPHIKALWRAALARGGIVKSASAQNFHGHVTTGADAEESERTIWAGLHISVTAPYAYTGKEGYQGNVNACFDFPKLFRAIEAEFLPEIKLSGRNPGFYEVKHDGRVEYRSLPSSLIRSKDFAARLHRVISS